MIPLKPVVLTMKKGTHRPCTQHKDNVYPTLRNLDELILFVQELLPDSDVNTINIVVNTTMNTLLKIQQNQEIRK